MTRVGRLLPAFILICRSLAAPQDAASLYKRYCANCHDSTAPRVPARSVLEKMSVERILRTLDFGSMMSIAYPLSRKQREDIANYLGHPGEEAPLPSVAFCSSKETPASAKHTANWIGWSPTFSNTRFQQEKNAGLKPADVPRLKLKWAFGFRDDITAFGAPTVSEGVLFTGSAGGTVYAMNAQTGCVYWTFQADGPVRAAPLVAPGRNGSLILVGDQIGWFYSIDARTGKLLWKQKIDNHEAARITGSAAFHDGIVFVPASSWEENRAISSEYLCCTFRGSVTAIRVSDGVQVWKTYLVDPPQKTGVTRENSPTFGPSGAAVWSAPTVDEKRVVLYVTTGNNYSRPATTTSDAVIALDLKTGSIVWSQQTTPNDAFNNACAKHGPNCPSLAPDYDFGSSAMLIHVKRKDLLIAGQKSGMVYALDPDHKGKILWQARVGKGGFNGGVQWGMTSDGKNVYAAVSDAVRLHRIEMSAPVGDIDFDPVKGGGLTALRLHDGHRLWFASGYPCTPPRPGCSPAQSAALTSIPGIVFSGSLDGHIRAFSTKDGKLVWDFDTVRDYTTVNGVPAKGGSLDGAGPVVVNGILYVNSGYPRMGGMPGNVLLAFSVDGK